MSEEEADRTEAAAATEEEAAPPADDAADSEMAGVVDQRAQELTGEGGSGSDTGNDPIAQAEEHLAGVDMDEQRRTLKEISKDM